ncbi:hypothetical protein cyc_08393 [Cyclospora cayetanensis]|uniref:Uncharacterized protein n=1 Tax=Cyclospora cayetanensis TaxID=88456 RepID=A0A1D3D7B3_9EIME|nr:hypothetical protein cyc_08393 [Cyclospora cayetanensis]
MTKSASRTAACSCLLPDPPSCPSHCPPALPPLRLQEAALSSGVSTPAGTPSPRSGGICALRFFLTMGKDRSSSSEDITVIRICLQVRSTAKATDAEVFRVQDTRETRGLTAAHAQRRRIDGGAEVWILPRSTSDTRREMPRRRDSAARLRICALKMRVENCRGVSPAAGGAEVHPCSGRQPSGEATIDDPLLEAGSAIASDAMNAACSATRWSAVCAGSIHLNGAAPRIATLVVDIGSATPPTDAAAQGVVRGVGAGDFLPQEAVERSIVGDPRAVADREGGMSPVRRGAPRAADTPKRHSQDSARSPRRVFGSRSRERTLAEHEKHPETRESRSRQSTASPSAERPTPELVSNHSSLSHGGDRSEEPDVASQAVRRQDQQISTAVQASTAHSDARESETPQRLRGGENAQLRDKSEREEPGVRQMASSLSPSLRHQTSEVEQDDTKLESSSATELPAPEQANSADALHPSESVMPPAEPEEAAENGSSKGDAPFNKEDSASFQKESHSSRQDSSKGDSSSSSLREVPKGQTDVSLDADGRTSSVGEREHENRVDTRGANASRVDEPINAGKRSLSGESSTHSSTKRNAAKRKIVATAPSESRFVTTDMHPNPRESPSRTRYRDQRLLSERGDFMTPNANRFQWNRPYRQNRFEREERSDLPSSPFPSNSGRSVGILGRGLPDRNPVAGVSNADGKWSHDLFEQLSNEPERKRRRFNLYGETLEKVDD